MPKHPCPKCGQSIRFPDTNAKLKVRCPACKHIFFYKGAAPPSLPTGQDSGPSSEKQKKASGYSKKKRVANSLGVPLGDLLRCLDSTTIKACIKGNTLVAQHEHDTTRIEVVPPEDPDSASEPIRAVVRVTTELTKPISDLLKPSKMMLTMNGFAALGALSLDHDRVYIGSRLTIYEAEDAWKTLHCLLLLLTTISGTEAITGAMARTLGKGPHKGGVSDWTKKDFALAKKYLSRVGLCTTDELRLTAEFGLDKGAVTASAGHRTALFRELADEPHPQLGGGLFCLLEMPHQIANEQRLQQICIQLNNMEMAANDLPPHFGAWTEGKSGGNPAYVSFFPNALHEAWPPITLQAGVWAMHRAQWANDRLASMGAGR